MMAMPIKNAMTVDVEDYFQVSAFEPYIDKSDWDRLPHRVENNTLRILDLFAEYQVKATFFVLGWVAERYPRLLTRMVRDGHEIASHGYEHIRVTEQSRDAFRADVVRTKALLEDLSGVAVTGYRAASYSITTDNLWALDELSAVGYQYSSSIYPIKHDLYGIPDAPRFAYYPRGDAGVLELPVTTLAVAGKRLPCGGGGFFRLYPYAFSKWALRRVNRVDGQSGMFYFHPWEIDPQQPRQSGINLKTRFRHYLNLSKMEDRLKQLLSDFVWDRMDRVFLTNDSSHKKIVADNS